jgi:hypothetical protein
VVVKHQYWTIGRRGEDRSGRLHPAERVFSAPWWVEAYKYTHEEGIERVDAPMLFTSEQAAETQLGQTEESEADSYLKLVEEHGEQRVNRAYNNTAPFTVLGINRDALADKLEDAEFLCVMVDGRMKLRQDFIEELRGDA